MLILVLTIAAGVCLAVGWLLEQIALVYVALGASAAGLVLIGIQVWTRRKQLRSTSDSVNEVADVADDDAVGSLADDAPVRIVAGRKRFHLAGCRLITGHDTEELTLVEAREEDFTPCTVCVEEESRELVATRQ